MQKDFEHGHIDVSIRKVLIDQVNFRHFSIMGKTCCLCVYTKYIHVYIVYAHVFEDLFKIFLISTHTWNITILSKSPLGNLAQSQTANCCALIIADIVAEQKRSSNGADFLSIPPVLIVMAFFYLLLFLQVCLIRSFQRRYPCHQKSGVQRASGLKKRVSSEDTF